MQVAVRQMPLNSYNILFFSKIQGIGDRIESGIIIEAGW